jgi:hypothetical protein
MRYIVSPEVPACAVLTTAADWAGPVGLDELDTDAALRTRVDVKYLVDAVRLHQVLFGMNGAAKVLEIDGRRSFRYRSVYFDTPDLASYRAHLQRRRRRYKVRTRTYLDAGRTMLELKYKGHRDRTVKRRMELDGDVSTALSHDMLSFLGDELHEAYGVEQLPVLEPSVTTDYRRTTFVLLDAGERVTCDIDLQGWHGGRTTQLDRRLALVESKSDDGAGTVDRIFRANGIRPVRISKHAVTVATTREDLPGNPWKPVARWFHTMNGSVPGAVPTEASPRAA